MLEGSLLNPLSIMRQVSMNRTIIPAGGNQTTSYINQCQGKPRAQRKPNILNNQPTNMIDI